MGVTDKSEEEISTFGYRWTEAERLTISFDDVDNAPKDIKRSAAARKLQRKRKRVHPSPLESLPLEVMHLILNQLDPGSLAALRSTSFSIRDQVDSLPVLKDLLKYAYVALKALGRTRLVHTYSITELWSALGSDRCAYCNAYGPYLYLLTCARCCFYCLLTDKDLVTLSLGQALRHLRSSKREFDPLIKLRTVYGFYARQPKEWKAHWNLVNWEAALDLKGIVADRRDSSRKLRSRFNFHASVAFPFVERRGDMDHVQHGLWCRGCEDNWYFHRSNRWNSRHYHDGQEADRRYYDRQEVAYSRLEFLEHYKRCSGIKRLKDLKYPNCESQPPYRRFIERS